MTASTRRILASESVIHRVLGAVRFVDPATRAPITAPLRVTADRRVTLRRNARGDLVIWRAEGLDGHTGHAPSFTGDAQFDALFEAPPGTPAAGSLPFVLTVEDPSGQRLAREVRVDLPRAATAGAPGVTPDLFLPVEVALFPSTAVRATGVGAAVYVLVHDGDLHTGRLPGALVTLAIDGATAGRGVTGATGEALVEVPSLPLFVPSDGDGEVVTSKIGATVRADVLPALIAREKPSAPWRLVRPPDPDSLDFQGPDARSGSAGVTLSAGRSASVVVSVSL